MTRRQLLQQQYGRTTPEPRPQVEIDERPFEPTTSSRQVEARDREPVQPKFSPNNLDIPAFLRRR
jgi:hypothetical protein